MIEVKLFGGPDDGAVQEVEIDPAPGAIVSTHGLWSAHGGIYQFAICEGWTSRGVYLGPASLLNELPSLGAPDPTDHGGRDSRRSGAPSDGEAA